MKLFSLARTARSCKNNVTSRKHRLRSQLNLTHDWAEVKLEARTLMTAQLVADLNKQISATLLFDAGETQFYDQRGSLVAVEDGRSKVILTDQELGWDTSLASFQKVGKSVLIESTQDSEFGGYQYLYQTGNETARLIANNTFTKLIAQEGQVFKLYDVPQELDLETGTFNTIDSPIANPYFLQLVPMGNSRFFTDVHVNDSDESNYFWFDQETLKFTPISSLDGQQSPDVQIVPLAGSGRAFLRSGDNVFLTDGTNAGTVPVFNSPQKLNSINAIGFGEGALLACKVAYYDWDNDLHVDHETLLNVSFTNPALSAVVFDSGRGGIDFPMGNGREVILSSSAGNVLCVYKTKYSGYEMEADHFYKVTADSTLIDLGSSDGAHGYPLADGKGEFFVKGFKSTDLLYHTSSDGFKVIVDGKVNTERNSGKPDIYPFHEKYIFIKNTYDVYGDNKVTTLNTTDGTANGTQELLVIKSHLAELDWDESPSSYHTMTSHGLVFQGWDAEHGTEPWISDGTIAGTHLLIDLVPGPKSSNAQAFLANAEGFSFIAENASSSIEQFEYNWETSQATSRALMLQLTEGSWPSRGVILSQENVVFQTGQILDNLYRLFVTDGSSEGTRSFFTSSHYISNICSVDGIVYFTKNWDELWKSDGTAEHTQFVARVEARSILSIEPKQINGNPGVLINCTNDLSTGDLDERWISDGTTAGTYQIEVQGELLEIVGDRVITLQREHDGNSYNDVLSAYSLPSGQIQTLDKQPSLSFLASFNNQVFMTTPIDGDTQAVYSTDGHSITRYELQMPRDWSATITGQDRLLVYPTWGGGGWKPSWYVLNQGDSQFTEFPISDYLQGGVIGYTAPQYNGNFIYFYVEHDEAETPYNEVWRTDGTPAGTQRLVSGTNQSLWFRVRQTGDISFIDVHFGDGRDPEGYQVLPDGSLSPTEFFDYVPGYDSAYNMLAVAGGKVLFSYSDPLVGAELFSLSIVEPVVVQSISNVTIDENLPWSRQVVATSGASTVRFSLVTGAQNGLVINPDTGLISWTPGESAGGQSYQVTVQAARADNPGMYKQVRFLVQVNDTNVPPKLAAISNQVVDETSTWTFQAMASDTDLPTQKLTYGLEGSVPDGLTLKPNTGELSWTPSELQGGLDYNVTVKVTDNGAQPLSAMRSFLIQVKEVNQAPHLAAISKQVVDETSTWNFQAVASDSDLPTQTLTYTLEGSVPDGLNIKPNTGELSWTPSELQGGLDFNVTVKVTDNGAQPLSATRSFLIHVNEVNQAPVLGEIVSQTVKEGQPLSITVSASDTDMPTQKLTFKLVGSVPVGASIDPVSGLFQWKPAYKAVSTNFTVEVSDDALVPAKSQKQFLVTVKPNPITVRFATVFNKRKQFTGLNVAFIENVDAVSSQKITAYKLVTAGRDKKFGTKDDVVVKLKSAKLQTDGKTILLTSATALSKTQTYQLSVLDTILDKYGRSIDGNKDGQFGGSAVTRIIKGLIG